MSLISLVRRAPAWLARASGKLALEFGTSLPLFIRPEQVVLGLGRRVRVLYASDLHLGHRWTRTVPEQLHEAARAARPDVLLLGGDLADNAEALQQLTACVASLTALALVAAVPGNHDVRPGIERVRAAVRAGGGHWLADASLEQPLPIDGRIGPASRGPRLLCAHYPTDFPEAVHAGYRLVLAGHLHGGQCVLATVRGKLYPAAWFHRWHGLRFYDGGATLLVSRGVADTLPIRFNCPREVILCEVL